MSYHNNIHKLQAQPEVARIGAVPVRLTMRLTTILCNFESPIVTPQLAHFKTDPLGMAFVTTPDS